MGQLREVNVPDIGDFTDIEIIEVQVAVGDRVSAEDPLITLESDKAAMDVPAPADGTVVEVHVSLGDRVSEGSPIVKLEVADEGAEAEGCPWVRIFNGESCRWRLSPVGGVSLKIEH